MDKIDVPTFITFKSDLNTQELNNDILKKLTTMFPDIEHLVAVRCDQAAIPLSINADAIKCPRQSRGFSIRRLCFRNHLGLDLSNMGGMQW